MHRAKEIIMMHRLAICFVFATSLFAAPRVFAAEASIQVVFATVDSVEIKNQDPCTNCSPVHAIVLVRGVDIAGHNPFTQSFDFGSNVDMATRCEHLAVIAMSKPGKYQFGIGSDNFGQGHGHCQLILVTP
jgi:hypothetical protein